MERKPEDLCPEDNRQPEERIVASDNLLNRIADLVEQLELLEKKLEEQVSEPKLLYTREQAADMLSISASSLDILISRGEIRMRQFGRQRMVPREELVRIAKKDIAIIWPERGPDGKTRRRIA